MTRGIPWRRMLPAGDSALLLDFGDEVSPELNAEVQTVYAVVAKASIPGLLGLVPAFCSLLVEYDARQISADALLDALRRLDYAGVSQRGGRVFDIPVWYGGEAGPDLMEVASRLHLSVKKVIATHTAQPFRIYCLGFAPGFPLAGILPEALRLPRREAPRPKVYAGAVAIAGSQTGIYPSPTPGGWHLIGRTPLTLFDWEETPPCLYEPGDFLAFRAISANEYYALARQSDRRPRIVGKLS